ncbi:MAG: hypothetical protein Q9218_006385 [Villophora microphyllina]
MKASEKSRPELDLSPASASVSSSRGTNGSDDSEGIVTKSLTGVNRRGVAPMAVFMSGGLAIEDVGEKKPKPLSTRKRVALSRIARQADHAKAIEDLKARRDAALEKERLAREAGDGKTHVQSTEVTKVPVLAKARSTSSATAINAAQPMPTVNTQVTRSRENSSLAIEKFKRRPRQPSLLQIAKAQVAAPELEDEDTLDDFAPEDASTPFKNTRTDPQHRLSSSSSRKRKLSTPEIQVPASQPQDPQDRSRSPPSSPPEDDFDIIAADSQPDPALPTIPRDNILPAQQPPIDSDTLAPPHSSSLPPSPQKLALDLKTRPKKSHKPVKATASILISPEDIAPPRSPTPTQSSPATTKPSRSPLKPLTTSALQNLLPRRRRVLSKNKENSVFDLGSSSDIDAREVDEDEDELSFHARIRPARKNVATDSKKGKGKGKPKKGEVGKVKKGGGRLSTTYTRKSQVEEAASDNENDDHEDASSDTVGAEPTGGAMKLSAKAREEMKRLRDKFQEVDEWGLDFEEVTGSSDRMRDAR